MAKQEDFGFDGTAVSKQKVRFSFTSVLISQGKHRLYTLAMPSDALAMTCTVDRTADNPESGFQRTLDEKRAQEIADYIDKGFGTIPGAIVLSAQKEADLKYNSKARTISFKNVPNAFFILDGQHRVFGFRKANTHLRVPVVIYNNLSRKDEVSLFMDINTKQRSVPNELILHIKRLAETENEFEKVYRPIFELFNSESDSPLFALLSPFEKKKGKISRTTFNGALKSISSTFDGTEPEYIYSVLKPYLHAWLSILRINGAEQNLTNSTLFKAIISFFPVVAERVSDRYDLEFSVENFDSVLKPVSQKLKKSVFQKPGSSHIELCDIFKNAFHSGFSIAKKQK